MDSTFSLVILFILGYYLTKFVFGMVRTVNDFRDIEQRVREHLGNIMHTVRIDIYDDIEYWYDKDEDQFLAQGRDLEEIVSVLKVRFPGHIFIVNNEKLLCAKTDWKLSDDLDRLKNLELSV